MILDNILARSDAFIAYITAGQHGLDFTGKLIRAIQNTSIDIVEVGVPFTDPIADGPIIQSAMQHALADKPNLLEILTLLKQLKAEIKTPIILFTYYNTLVQVQKYDIYQLAHEAGIQAMIVVDLPIEESTHHHQQCLKFQISPIFIVTPNTSEQRILQISQYSRSCIYYACRSGTTGLQTSLPKEFKTDLQRVKRVSTLPVIVGFGISNSAMAKAVIKEADGFVIGSALVNEIARSNDLNALCHFIQSLDPRKEKTRCY